MRPTTRLLPAALLLCPLVACVPETPRPPPQPVECTDPDAEPEAVEADLLIEKASDWDDADLPSGCWDLYGTLEFSGPEITSLKDFDRLKDLAGANHLIVTNTKLTKIDAPEALYIYGRVEITDNASLTSLKGIDVDKDEALDIIIENNAALTDLGTLTDVTKIGGVDPNGAVSGGYFRVNDNAKLASVTFDRLKEIHTELLFRNNAELTTVNLPRLEVVRDLTLRDNAKLTSVGTMNALTQILGNVTIEGNKALNTLGLFSSGMQFITGSLTIRNNAVLSNLGQVSHLQGILNISIQSNPALPACLAQEVAECVPQHGTVSISNNQGTATGCNYWCK